MGMAQTRKQKENRILKMSDLTAKASIIRLRTSAQKLNLVAASIRNMKVSEAIVQLKFSPKRIAVDVRKCLQSAVANAENNMGLDIDNLIVKEAYVGKALTMKRFHARGRGRSGKILKPFSHITVVVSEEEVVA